MICDLENGKTIQVDTTSRPFSDLSIITGDFTVLIEHHKSAADIVGVDWVTYAAKLYGFPRLYFDVPIGETYVRFCARCRTWMEVERFKFNWSVCQICRTQKSKNKVLKSSARKFFKVLNATDQIHKTK